MVEPTTHTLASMNLLSIVGSSQFADDPYPYFRKLRTTAPVLRTDAGIWLVSRYADVARCVRDKRLSCDFSTIDSYAEYFRARGIDERFPLPLNGLDPPEHGRIRSAVAPEFAPHAVHAMRAAVEETVERVLDDIVAAGRHDIDLVEDVAYPVPIAVIARLFGIPDEDRPTLRKWSEAFGAVSDPDPLLTDDQRRAAAEATREAGAYFGRLLTARRRNPGDDLMSRWLASTSMSVAELLVNGVFLLIVGHHNTVSLICNGMLALLRHPDQLDRLRREPALMDNGIEELLRYDSPVQTSTRVTVEPYEIDGVEIPARRQVMLLLGSANRDEAAFAEPDRLDVSRADAVRNLGFGRGIHSCVGGPLARLEAGATLSALVRRFPELAQSGPVRRRVPCFTLRMMTSLPMNLGPAADAPIR